MYKYDEWTELSAENTTESITARVWNREIRLDRSIFPTSVKVGGDEILYSPIELNAEFENGEVGIWEKQRVILHEKTDEKAVYTLSQSTHDIMVNADVTVEFDGLVRVDFRIIPFWNPAWLPGEPTKPSLRRLGVRIPLKNEFAGLFHYWPNCESAVCLSGRILNSYATPQGKTVLPFKPYIWAGWEDGGMGICCESDKSFELNDRQSCITVTRDGECTSIDIALLDYLPREWQKRHDEWGNTLKPIAYSLAFQPTPVKEFDKNNLKEWRAFHLYNISRPEEFSWVYGSGSDSFTERVAASGAKWLILHEDWTMVQNYGVPYDEEIFKEFVRKCHRRGLKVMVYFGYEISSLCPGFDSMCDEYLNKNARGNFVGGWQREPMQRDYTVCYNGGYSDIMIKRVEYVMDNYGVDGIYTDGTYVPWECANEAHGCGRRDAEGKLHETYPIYAVREHVKKLYAAVHARGGRIDTHQSSCCMMATLAFADSYFDGENIQGFLKEDIGNLKTDTFRAEFMGQNMGIPCNFISYTSEDYTMRLLSGNTLIHNVFPRANHIGDLDYISRLWRIYDDFGTDKAEWCPYWREQSITTEDERAYMSYYKRDGEALLIINPLNKAANEVKIRLDAEYSEAVDLLDGCRLEPNGRTLTVPAEYATVKLIRLRK